MQVEQALVLTGHKQRPGKELSRRRLELASQGTLEFLGGERSLLLEEIHLAEQGPGGGAVGLLLQRRLDVDGGVAPFPCLDRLGRARHQILVRYLAVAAQQENCEGGCRKPLLLSYHIPYVPAGIDLRHYTPAPLVHKAAGRERCHRTGSLPSRARQAAS